MSNIVCENLTDPNNVPQPFANSELRAEIAKGNVDGVIQAINFGHLLDIDPGDGTVDLWEGAIDIIPVYPGFPAESETLEIFSTHANDSAEGSGAHEITITGLLDANGIEQPDVTVELNGANPVSLGPLTYNRVSRIWVHTCGSTGSNEGAITLRHTTTVANIFAYMPVGHNITASMIYTVPAGKTLYVQRGYISMSRANGSPGSANCIINVRGYYPDAPFIPARDVEITDSQSYVFANGGFFVFPERTDIKVTVRSVSDTNTTVGSEYDGFLADNDV